MFDLSKIFDLRKILALPNNLHKLKNKCTKIRLIRKTESLSSYESIFSVALRSCLLSFSAHRQHQISFRNGRITTLVKDYSKYGRNTQFSIAKDYSIYGRNTQFYFANVHLNLNETRP